MALTKEKSYEILGLEKGAETEDIRAAYKRLALQWHPDKHKNSDESTKKFQEISSAYKCLTSKDEEQEVDFMGFEEMFELFARLFFGRGFPHSYMFYEDINDDTDSDGSDDDSGDYFQKKYNSERSHVWEHTSRHDEDYSFFPDTLKRPSASEAMKNGEQLIEEEERQKKQRERRRERKKRQKQRKKQEKIEGKTINNSINKKEDKSSGGMDNNKENISNNNKKKNNSNGPSIEVPLQNGKMHNSSKTNSSQLKDGSNTKNKAPVQNGSISSESESDEDTQGLDLNSAFFAGAVSSANKKLANQNQGKKSKKGIGRKNSEQDVNDTVENRTQRSRQLAIRGNEMANKENYQAAIDLFTQAIHLDPNDHRFFGNRSFCFDQKELYDRALKDAEKAISLAKDWPKGYFRKGRALAGLKLYNEAESSFEQVLRLDPSCADAVQELKRVRVCQLMDMGFTRSQSEVAILKCGTVQDATDALLSGTLSTHDLDRMEEEVYISDEEDYIDQTIRQGKLDPKNPEHLRSLWIGNLGPNISEKAVRDLFGKYGGIESIRRLPEKYCAFINYSDHRMASRAMAELQGYSIDDCNLLIKFPDNPITEHHLNTIVLKKKPSTSPVHEVKPKPKPKPQSLPPQLQNGGKVSGPVNGNECYYWRTTGCWYGDRCRYKHLEASKGADMKPWMGNDE